MRHLPLWLLPAAAFRWLSSAHWGQMGPPAAMYAFVHLGSAQGGGTWLPPLPTMKHSQRCRGRDSQRLTLWLTFELGVVSTSMARLRGVRRPRAANWGVLVPPLIRLPAAAAVPIPASLGVASDRPCKSTAATLFWDRKCMMYCTGMLHAAISLAHAATTIANKP
jgi:hypothetical protein